MGFPHAHTLNLNQMKLLFSKMRSVMCDFKPMLSKVDALCLRDTIH